MSSKPVQGRISSFQSLGAVDGPGLRCVVFMQGCPLRCAYCHNPETWSPDGGELYDAEELLAKIRRFRPFVQNGGGVTVSGGEPLLQGLFVAELFEKLRAEGYHTALDTSGVGDLNGARAVLAHTDLVICDVKFTNAADYQTHCHGDLQQVLDFLSLCKELEKPLWLRQVIVPAINDSVEQIDALKALAAQYPSVQKLELLPFRTLCEPKYESMGLPFKLAGTKDCPAETIQALEARLFA